MYTLYITLYIYIYYSVYINSMENYSALKENEIMIHATTWMNLEDIMSSEINQTQRKILYNSAMNSPIVVKFIETESKMVISR